MIELRIEKYPQLFLKISKKHLTFSSKCVILYLVEHSYMKQCLWRLTNMTTLKPMDRSRVFGILNAIFQEFGSVYGEEPAAKIMSRVGITMKESASDPFSIDFYDEDNHLISTIRIINPNSRANIYTIVYQNEFGKSGRITITRDCSTCFSHSPLIGSLMYTSIRRGVSKLQDYVRELTRTE